MHFVAHSSMTSSVVTTIVGARPQFVKAGVVSEALRHAGISERLIHTGQHYDEQMSAVFFDELGLASPDANLDVHGGGHGAMTGRMLERIEKDLIEHPPGLVLVYGDTNSTLAGALAAVKLGIPVAHVEAGLRSFNPAMPEEVNRILTDHVSAWLFCPTHTAVSNLDAEGIHDGVFHVGDVMFDAAMRAARLAEERSSILERLQLAVDEYILATVHRAENTDDRDRLEAVMAHLRGVAGDVRVVLPLHPRTRQALAHSGVGSGDVELIDPVGYVHMTQLLIGAREIHTDSGGLQKEAYFHGVPCVTLRSETEWIETIQSGWNRLWTVSAYEQRRDITDYGDGTSARKIADLLVSHFRSAPTSQPRETSW